LQLADRKPQHASFPTQRAEACWPRRRRHRRDGAQRFGQKVRIVRFDGRDAAGTEAQSSEDRISYRHCPQQSGNIMMSGAFSDYHSFPMLREPSPAIGCKSEMAVSSPAQVFLRCITRTAFLVLRGDLRLPIVA
jgi:hypothetical protein